MPPRRWSASETAPPPRGPERMAPNYRRLTPGGADEDGSLLFSGRPDYRGEPVPPPETPTRHRLARGTARLAFGTKWGRRVVATGTVLTLGVGYFAHEQDAPAAAYSSCIDGGHDALMLGNTSDFLGIDALSKDSLRGAVNDITLGHAARDNQTWDAIAATEYQHFGWLMDPAALAQENPGLSHITKDGSYSNVIHHTGSVCIALVAPQIPDVQSTDGKHNVQYYWSDHSTIGLNELKRLNPGLKGDGQALLRTVLPAGKSLVFSAHPSMDLVYRNMMENNLGEVAKNDIGLQRQIKASQPAHVSIEHGKPSYLLPIVTKYMRDHHITETAVDKAFAGSYTDVGFGQVVAPRETKPLTLPSHSERYDSELAANLAVAELMAEQGGKWVYVSMFMEYFLKKGLTPAQISGLGGNTEAESGLDPTRVQNGPDAVDLPEECDGNTGYFWQQWTSCGRIKNLKILARSEDRLPSDPQVQLDDIWQELNGPYRSVLDSLRQATTPTQASDIIMGPDIVDGNRAHGYENPNAQYAHQDHRRQYSVDIYNLFTQLKRSIT